MTLEAGSEMLDKSWSLESHGASSNVLLRGHLRTRMETHLASLVPVEGVTEEKTETVIFPYTVHENHKEANGLLCCMSLVWLARTTKRLL